MAARGLIRAAAGLALAAALAIPGAAAGRAWRLPGNQPLQASGSLVYSWHGDPARGCAALALCGVQGALVITRFRDPWLAGTLLELGAAGTVRVGDGPGAGECVDGSMGAQALQLKRVGARRFRGTLLTGTLSGRCAEPLGTELSGLALPVRLLGPRHRPSLDLRSSASFSFGPFSGSLRSTLVLRPRPPAGGSSSSIGPFSVSSGSANRGATARRVLAEFVNLAFRARPLESSLLYQFAGAGQPVCQILDSCATQGSLAVAVTGPELTLTLSAVRRVHARVSSRAALADFKHGGLRFNFPGFSDFSTHTHERLTRADGTACQDDSSGRLTLLLGSFTPNSRQAAGARVPVSLSSSSQSQDVLRTHCPGPAASDVLEAGTQPAYAAGTVSTRSLLQRRIEVTLSGAGSFSGLGYLGRRGGAISLELTRRSVHAGTEGGG